MSYDFSFTIPRITKQDFEAYFHGKPNYEITKAQAAYQNKDTGVYFLIDYNEPEEDDLEEIHSTLILNLNYYRPSFFALEAADEISELIRHFGFLIHDPQNEEMGGNLFSKDDFICEWNHGNEFGYSIALQRNNISEQVYMYPGKHLEDIWRWNFEKVQVQESFSEDRFVPDVFFMKIDQHVVSVAVWPDAISELIPEVDYLFIVRKELGPKPLFRKRQEDQILLPFCEIAPDLEIYATSEYSLPAYNLPAPTTPKLIRRRIRNLKPTGITGEGISIDQIMNEEIVMKYKKS